MREERNDLYVEYKKVRNDFDHEVGNVTLIHDWGDGDLDQLKWQKVTNIWKEKLEGLGGYLHSQIHEAMSSHFLYFWYLTNYLEQRNYWLM